MLQISVIFALAAVLMVAWLLSEFQPRRWPRILLGSLSLAMCVFLALGLRVLERFNYNAWYGTASAELIDTTISEFEGGRTDRLVPALRELRGEFYPTYENRAHYDQLVEQFVRQVKQPPPE